MKVFDSSGKFVKQSSLCTVKENFAVATDMSDNIFVLAEPWVCKLTKTADLHHRFRLRGGGEYDGLSVSGKGTVVTLLDQIAVEEYDTDGKFVRTFGQEIINSALDVTVANDGLVMVLDQSNHCQFVDVFSESGDYLHKFKLQRRDCLYTSIAFHRASEHVVVAGFRVEEALQVDMYSKDGEFVYHAQIPIDGGINIPVVTGISVTTKGRIACVTDDKVLIF